MVESGKKIKITTQKLQDFCIERAESVVKVSTKINQQQDTLNGIGLITKSFVADILEFGR